MKAEGRTKNTSQKKVVKTRRVKISSSGRPPRANFLGFRRGKTTQNENQALVRIEGLNDRNEVNYYLGKRIVFIQKNKRGYTTIWGKVASAHGNNGTVKAIFRKNLPPRAIGSTLRVMLYPQRPL